MSVQLVRARRSDTLIWDVNDCVHLNMYGQKGRNSQSLVSYVGFISWDAKTMCSFTWKICARETTRTEIIDSFCLNSSTTHNYATRASEASNL